MAATDVLQVRVKPALAVKVRRQAAREGVKINAWLTAAIEQALAVEKP